MSSSGAGIERLVAIMTRLRDPEGGCPWDLAQDFASIAPHTIEEAHEVADAIERQDFHDLRDELGDLLLQVVFHARMAEEAGLFRLEDVVESIVAKMIRRNPHVFGDGRAGDAGAVKRQWEDIKAQERAERQQGARASVLDGVALALPALLRAQKLSDRAGRTGFDWPDPAGARAKLLEELAELDAAATSAEAREEAGDLLFAAVNLLRKLGIDAESALRAANAKFERRFRAIEAADGFADLPLSAKEQLWQEVKGSEADTPAAGDHKAS